jgi:hypothetical protein
MSARTTIATATMLLVVSTAIAQRPEPPPPKADMSAAQSTGLKDLDTGVSVSPEDAAEIWAVMDKYLYNYRMPIQDYIDKHLETLLFPHVRIASHQVLILPTAKDYKDIASRVDEFMQAGWDHSAWATRKVVQADTEKVHVAVTFNRYKKDNSLINVETSFYILEKINGHWGIRGRSSFAK